MVKLYSSALLVLTLSACGAQVAQDKESSKVESLIAPAELVSLDQVTVNPPNVKSMWQFKIEYMAKENSLVNEGDLILKFDGQKLRNDLISYQSELDAAIKEAEKQALYDNAKLEDLKLELAEAQMNEDKARRKVEITDVSRSAIEREKQQAEYMIAKEAHKQAQQKVEQHQTAMRVNQQVQEAKITNRRVRLATLQEGLNKLTVFAPKQGMIVYNKGWDDEKPAIGDTVYMGRPLIDIPSLDKIAVQVEFDESNTAKVYEGQAVLVTLDAYPERPFNGKIDKIGASYRSKSQWNQKVVFDAWIKLDNLDTSIMRPGMKASVEISEAQG